MPCSHNQTHNSTKAITTKQNALLMKSWRNSKPSIRRKAGIGLCAALTPFSPLGIIAWRRRNANAALNYSRQVLALAEEYSLTEVTPKCLNLFGNVYNSLSDYPCALEHFVKALAAHEVLGDKAGVARVTRNIGNVYNFLSDYPRALEHYIIALAAHEELGDKAGAAIVMGNIGIVYGTLSDYPRALDHYVKAFAVHEELGDKEGAARVMGNIGNVYSVLTDYPRVLEHYIKALTAYNELGDKAGVAIVTGNIGNVYSDLSDYATAVEYYGKALELDEQLGNKAQVAAWFGNIGLVHSNLSDYPRALEYMVKALATYEEIGNKAGAAYVTGNIGTVYNSLSDYPRVLEYMVKALAAYEEIGNKADAALVTGNIGSIYGKKDFDGYDAVRAEKYLLKAIAMNEELGTKKYIYFNHKAIAELYENEEQWKESQQHLKKYHEIEKEVQNDEAKKQMHLMEHRRKIEESERDRQVKLARFQEQEKILHNILPSQIADRMIDGEKTIADSHENVSVFFSDIVGFTKLSQRVSAEELVGMLNGIFIQFDQLARKHGLEKIKTIGDAYMAVCGAPVSTEDHATRTACFALDVAELMNNYQTNNGDNVMIRIGLHSGSVVAGIIGENKFAYDLWGDAVNTASRMESHGEPGKIHCSEEFVRALSLSSFKSFPSFKFQERGEMEIKGKGMMKTYFLENLK
ncbi:MAG: tetratricopeptide repeat protein [Ignavibacteria bacterium]|nr:tetratricopeptide repeat protein [Ignavibacteria bacterium]